MKIYPSFCVALVLFVTTTGCRQETKTQAPRGFEPNLVAEWQAAGWEPGYYTWAEFVNLKQSSDPPPARSVVFLRDSPARSSLPAFLWNRRIAKKEFNIDLPEPSVPFALVLVDIESNLSKLKFNNLVALSFGAGDRRLITDAKIDNPDAAIATIPVTTKLLHLDLRFTEATDTALDHVAKFENLEQLALGHCKIGDDGIKKLANHKTLSMLGLGGTQITQKALSELAKCNNLQELDLMDTNVSDAGIEELQKALPKLSVHQR